MRQLLRRWYYKTSIGSVKFFRLTLLQLSDSEIAGLIERFEAEIKDLKDEFFRISWYMRGGVTADQLFYLYSYEDRTIMNNIIKENIELTKKTGNNFL